MTNVECRMTKEAAKTVAKATLIGLACEHSVRCYSSRFHESAHGAFDLFWRRRPIANTDSDHRSSMPG